MDKWVWVVQLIITIVIGIIGYFLKEISKATNRDIEENKTEISSIRKELNEFKETMPFHYVLRDDFIRAITSIDKKLDKIYDIIALNKKGSE